jgi:hypothetical protein
MDCRIALKGLGLCSKVLLQHQRDIRSSLRLKVSLGFNSIEQRQSSAALVHPLRIVGSSHLSLVVPQCQASWAVESFKPRLTSTARVTGSLLRPLTPIRFPIRLVMLFYSTSWCTYLQRLLLTRPQCEDVRYSGKRRPATGQLGFR